MLVYSGDVESSGNLTLETNVSPEEALISIDLSIKEADMQALEFSSKAYFLSNHAFGVDYKLKNRLFQEVSSEFSLSREDEPQLELDTILPAYTCQFHLATGPIQLKLVTSLNSTADSVQSSVYAEQQLGY